MAKAIEAGIPKMRIEEAAARTQARIDSGRQPVIGVNKYLVDGDEGIEVLKVDNASVRTSQLAKLDRLRAERDEEACRAALDRLTWVAEHPGESGNLLGASIDAARAMATVGEISAALERVFGRYTAAIRTISGVYSSETGGSAAMAEAHDLVSEFEKAEDDGPASSWPRWARTATTVARRSSRRPSRTWASTSTWARSSRPPPRWPGRPWTRTCTWSGSPRSPLGT